MNTFTNFYRRSPQGGFQPIQRKPIDSLRDIKGANWEQQMSDNIAIRIESATRDAYEVRDLDNSEADLNRLAGQVALRDPERGDVSLSFDSTSGEIQRYASHRKTFGPDRAEERRVLDLRFGLDYSSVDYTIHSERPNQLREERIEEITEGVFAHQFRWTEPSSQKDRDEAFIRQDFIGPGAPDFTK